MKLYANASIWVLVMMTFSSDMFVGVGAAQLFLGIPEPGLMFYGEIRNTRVAGNPRLTSGELTWGIRALPSGPIVLLTNQISDIDGRFSFRIHVPFETRAVSGFAFPPTPAVFDLTTGDTDYQSVELRINGHLITNVPAAMATFKFSSLARGVVRRADLTVSLPLIDSDADGLPDDWEKNHFGDLRYGTNDDPDRDGRSNRLEYDAGTDPTVPDGPMPFHSADYRETRWVIDGQEVNRVLSYWRSAAHHIDPIGFDSYAAGVGNTNGVRHAADFRSPYWQIDGTEVSRVLGYWRAAGYHANPAGADGYAPGLPAGSQIAPAPARIRLQALYRDPLFAIQHTDSSTPVDKATLLVTNRLEFSGSLQSLLMRPHLPPEWHLGANAQGNGSPIQHNGEIVFTSFQLESPLLVVYEIQRSTANEGNGNIRTEVEYQFIGDLNPKTTFSEPDPLEIIEISATGSTLAVEVMRSLGGIQISWATQIGNATLETADPTLPILDWQPVNVVPVIANGFNVVLIPSISGSRLYRLRR